MILLIQRLLLDMCGTHVQQNNTTAARQMLMFKLLSSQLQCLGMTHFWLWCPMKISQSSSWAIYCSPLIPLSLMSYVSKMSQCSSPANVPSCFFQCFSNASSVALGGGNYDESTTVVQTEISDSTVQYSTDIHGSHEGASLTMGLTFWAFIAISWHLLSAFP